VLLSSAGTNHFRGVECVTAGNTVFTLLCVPVTFRSVDYNPNKPLTLITAGSDRKVKVWDSRNLSRAVKVLAGHSHWVWSAKYNPNHDQLIVRCVPRAVNSMLASVAILRGHNLSISYTWGSVCTAVAATTW
jgi:WD40 repeat protein